MAAAWGVECEDLGELGRGKSDSVLKDCPGAQAVLTRLMLQGKP